MDYPSLSEVRSLVEEANVPRWRGDASGGDNVSDARRAERRLEDLFGTARALATYGTLAPGRPNHHVVAPFKGEWSEGLIEGYRRILVPVFAKEVGSGQEEAGERRLDTVANLYAPTEADPGASAS